MSQTSSNYDALVIGAGHNGLVHAAYLARAGLQVAVLERSDSLGGATRSQEAHPGFTYSVFSYLVSLLRPEIIQELDLVRHGLRVTALEGTYNPLPGGDELYREACSQRTIQNIARHSKRDAENYLAFKQEMTWMARWCHRLQNVAPPELAPVLDGKPGEVAMEDLGELGGAWNDLGTERGRTFLQMLTMSAEDFLRQWFEGEALIAALSTSSIIGSFLSPRSPGSAYVLLHHYMGEVDGVYRGWGWARGGTGAVAQAIANSAAESGAEVHLNAPVSELLIRGDRAVGVVLEDGRELRAATVTSSAGPQLSLDQFLGREARALMPPKLLAKAARWQSAGCSGKVNLALDGVPEFASRPGLGAHHAGGISIAPSVDYIEEAYVEAKYGRPSSRPFIDMVIPSVIDPTVAPSGKHMMSCFVQYLPYELRAPDGGAANWEDEREAVGDAVVRVLAEYIPKIEDLIVHRQVMTPMDVERVAGIPGGNIFHGELTLGQLFLNRPGAAAAAFRTPIPGYYLCGSATHPGGGISGAPGRHAAQRVLNDLSDMGEFPGAGGTAG